MPNFGTKGTKVCQENIAHTITPPPPACTVVTRHDGSMFSFCLHQILPLPSECLNRHFFFPICSGDECYPMGSSAVVAHPPQLESVGPFSSWRSGDCLDQDHTPTCIEATAM